MRFVRVGTRPPDILLISPTFAENIDSDGYRDLKSEAVESENTGDVVRKRQRPVHFVVGQQVWRRDKSLSSAAAHYAAKPKIVGPFVIARKCSSWTYEMSDGQGTKLEFGMHKF